MYQTKAVLWLESLEAWSGKRKTAEDIVNSTDIKDTVGVEIRLNWANDLVNIYNDINAAEIVFEDLIKSDPWEGTFVTIEAIRQTAPGFKTANLSKQIVKEENLLVPYTYKLGRAYPNPFNPSTTITYDIPESGIVKIEVFDITGRLVKTLLDEYKESGHYQVIFNGNGLSSGLYIYRMISGNFKDQSKMLLIK